MKSRWIKYIFILFLSFLYINGIAKKSKIDSLISIISKDKEDTNKVSHLIKLSRNYFALNNFDSAIYCNNTALEILNSSKPISTDENLILKYKAIIFDNNGSIYLNKSDYPKSLNNYFKSLKLYEDLGIKNRIADCYSAIGVVFDLRGDLNKELTYYIKAYKLYKECNDKSGMGIVLGNIGIVYLKKHDNYAAVEYFTRALKIDQGLGNKKGILRHFANLGSLYVEQADRLEIENNDLFQKQIDSLLYKALDYYSNALKLNDELGGDKHNACALIGNIGSVYVKQKKFVDGEIFLMKSLKISQEINDIYQIMETYQNLSDLYSLMGNYEKSLYFYKNSMVFKDSLFNVDKNSEFSHQEMNYEIEKKEAIAKVEQTKKEAILKKERERQQLLFWLVTAIAIAVALISLIIFRSLNVTRKQKSIIEKQKELVEEKQKEILDSIHYAKRIQQSLLPTEKYIDKNLKKLNKKA